MTQTLITNPDQQVDRSARTAPSSIPENVTAAKALIVAESAKLCAAAVGQKARAIVLTGSMSRGETTLQRDGAAWRVLGDATFLIVFDGPVHIQVAELEREIQRGLLARGVSCKIVVVTATADNLRNMKPHIYAYELKERGVVVWGDRNALSLIPRFAAAAIPKEDGWWLLCNRMIEQIETAAESDTFNDDCTAVRYRIAKLYLAMSACYLLAIGRYAPTYRDRAARLQELADGSNAAPTPLPLRRFSSLVSRCTHLKLHGETEELTHDFPRWRDAVSDGELIWRWSLGQILGLSPTLGRKDLLGALAARQPIFARAKGWLRAVYVQRSGLRREWLRWTALASSSSPRYLVYGAASELFFMTQEPAEVTPNQLAAVVRKLPISPPAIGRELSWNAVAKLVAHNFHALLESNRC